MATPTLQDLMALPPEYLNQVNPMRTTLYNCSIAFLVVNTVIFFLFIVSMRMTGQKAAAELYVLMPISYLCIVGNCIFGLLLVTIGGNGRHIAYWLLHDPHTIKRYLQLQAGVEITYTISIVLPKIAILTLYLRVFVDRIARLLTWILIYILVLFLVGVLLLAFTECRPYAYKWDKSIPGTCADVMAGYRWVSVPSIITDFFILIIPIPVIWKLQMNKGRKIGVFLAFLVGGLGFITAIIRFTTFYGSDLMSDPTYLSGSTMSWTLVESSAYFMCACMARLRPVLQWILEKSGLRETITTSFRSILGSTRTTKPSFVRSSKKSGGFQGESDPMSKTGKVGFVELGEFQRDSQSSSTRDLELGRVPEHHV